MTVEAWAKQVVEQELGLPVAEHDDGSFPGLYDLRVGVVDAQIAIECVGAVDSARTETWNIGPGRGPLSLALNGDWHVGIEPTTRLKGLGALLQRVLQACEQRGAPEYVEVDWRLKLADPEMHKILRGRRVTWIGCFRTAGSGKVVLSMEGVGGAVDAEGTIVHSWIGEFLLAPARADVIEKLQRSGALERHVFVTVDFGGAPWPVESYLTGDLESLPQMTPDLPSPITGVWLVSTRAQYGVRWSSMGWSRFLAWPHHQ